MKKVSILVLMMMCLFGASMAQQAGEVAPPAEAESAPDAVFKWDKGERHDFGKVPKGKPVSNEYWFTNVGTDTLYITNVKRTCGCTTPDWTKNPIPPGERGYVKATYNAAREGGFHKAVTVMSKSTTPTTRLYLKGTVVAPPPMDFNDNSMMSAPAGSQ